MFQQLSKFSQSLRQSARSITTRQRPISSRQWREKNNKIKSRLDELPDWSYVDGRGFGPPSIAQKERYIRDQELAQTVVRRYKELESVKPSNEN